MKLTKIAFFTLSFTFFLSGCANDPEPENHPYGPGIFVVNEGNFGSPNGSVSFIDRSSFTVANAIYQEANDGVLLGDVVQSVTIADSFAYIIVNNSSKMEIVNAYTFEHKQTITGLQLPRFFVAYNGRGYISEWVSFGVNGRVKVIDLTDYSEITTIPTGIAPDRMLLDGDRLFVANSNDASVTVINADDATFNTNITVGDWPNSMVKDAAGNIRILCGGVPSWAGTATSGSLVSVNPQTAAVNGDISFGSTAANPSFLCANSSGNTLYYNFNGSIYSIGTGANTIPASGFIASPAGIYGMGVDPVTEYLFVADAGNFSSAGTVKCYNPGSGALVDSAAVGIAPNGFYFWE